MTELRAPHLTSDQASPTIAADIRAFPKDGPDKREEHLRLYGDGLISREVIEAAWADRYPEIARAQPPPPKMIEGNAVEVHPASELRGNFPRMRRRV